MSDFQNKLRKFRTAFDEFMDEVEDSEKEERRYVVKYRKLNGERLATGGMTRDDENFSNRTTAVRYARGEAEAHHNLVFWVEEV